jgi:FkbM family methyltransferase
VEPTPSPFVLKALRSVPAFRGKGRIARTLLSAAARQRCTLIRDRCGNPMVVPNLVEPVGFSLGLDGAYEPDLVDFLRRQLNGELDFVDVGANIGSFTIALAGAARRVLAVEASPAVLPFLRRNIEMSQRTNVVVSDFAASAPAIERVLFYIPPMDHFGMGSSAAQFNVDPVSLAARPLDQILHDSGINRVGALKVDVEGFEAHVLLGAIGLLNSQPGPIVVFEFCDWAEERAFPGRKGWAQQIMLDAGYALWPLPQYANGSAPLAGPITQGCHTIVCSRQ